MLWPNISLPVLVFMPFVVGILTYVLRKKNIAAVCGTVAEFLTVLALAGIFYWQSRIMPLHLYEASEAYLEYTRCLRSAALGYTFVSTVCGWCWRSLRHSCGLWRRWFQSSILPDTGIWGVSTCF